MNTSRGRSLAAMAVCLPALLGPNPSSRAGQDPSLVAHYTFEEGPGGTVKDWSGFGNDGRNAGAEYVELPGGPGYALRFADGEAYVNCGNGPSLDLTEALTIELWLYPESYRVKGGEPGLVGKSLSSYMLSFSNACWFYVAHGALRTDCAATTTLREWNHIVVTFDGRISRTYTDGREVRAEESPFSQIDHGQDFYLRYPVVWDGKVEPPVRLMMDDVRVYSRALPAREVSAHYRREARTRGKDLSRFEKAGLAAHVSAAAREAVLEVDVSGMQLAMFAPGATLMLQLVETASGRTVARRGVEELPESGMTDWTVSTAQLVPGGYEYRAAVRDKDGKPFGVPAAVAVTVPVETPAWMRAYERQNRLNNLVAELLDLQDGQAETGGAYTVENVRDGWVFISSTAAVEGNGRTVVAVGGESAIVHTSDAGETVEAMRYLPAGLHKLSVRCDDSAPPARLVVRAIPEMIYAELGYDPCPWFRGYGPYTWEHLEKIGLLDCVNVILQRNSTPADAARLAAWREQGKKRVSYYCLTWLLRKEGPLTADSTYAEWSRMAGLASPGYDGLMLDELSGGSHAEQFPAFTAAVNRIAANAKFKGRTFNPYCGHMYRTEASRSFTKAVFDAGYRLVEEKYLLEQPTEAEALAYMSRELKLTMLRYQDYFSDCATRTIMNLGFISIPQEMECIEPGTDFKVYMDMQMNMLANDPVFLGLYGVMWYHSAYADEELLRWAAKLYRHYCIDGKRERLTDDPYELPHISNGDFDQGTDGWTLEPAEEGSISVRRALGYGHIQGRMARDGRGDNVLVTRRSVRGPNRFRQPVRQLTPGRLYSLKMFVMDYGDFHSGKSAEKTHRFRMDVHGGVRVPARCFRETLVNAKQLRPFSGKNRLHMAYCRVVFRAQRATGQLVISDWARDDDPGGPEGQQLAFNFIGLQPYLED